VTRHVILVGLPGAGKTTVGRRVSELLPASFTDIDEAVEAETGQSIARIFGESGEAEFRRLERAAMDRALAGPHQLIAAGAGWIAQEGNLQAARERNAWIVYLRIAPPAAALRLGEDAVRPLLARGDRRARLEDLLAEREAWYQKADAVVEGDADVETVAQRVAESVRALG
jgi:shikimate kinase